MAETLREGCSYKLITESGDETENNEKRQVYFVKLTDSCLKAIEEYTNELRTGSQSKPSIRFDGKNGAVVIPIKCAMQNVQKKFRFGVSNVFSSDNNPLQECIKHCNLKSNELLSYGPLAQKISIAATDDCYENTKNKMALVEQERKDIRTKEIKLSTMKKGKKVNKLVAPDGHKINAIKSMKRSNPHALNSPKPVASSNTLPTALQKKSPIIHSSKKSPTTTPSINSNLPPTGDKGFSLRDRVIHILALRTHKKVELFSRLQREGMSQKDGSNLSMILQQVASHSDNHYGLLRQLYAELQVDSWPFYSINERATVRRNMAPPSKELNPTSPQVVSSTSKSPDEKTAKRPISVNTSNTNNKKQKVENSEEPSSTSKSPIKPPENKQTDLNISNSNKSNESKLQGEETPPIVSSNSDSPEYLSIYKSITSTEQRFKYKCEFQSEYPEYIKLKSNVDAVGTKFIKLDMALRSTEKGSLEYFRIQDEIITAYNEQDEKYHAMKRRCQELHEKLSHIKRLVMEYDSNHMVNS